jgi:hypothetical protein
VWVELKRAPDQITAEIWVGVLRDAGVPAMVHPADAVSYLGLSPFTCRVQVPEEHLEHARELLADEPQAESDA